MNFEDHEFGLSTHSIARIRERLGLPKRAAKRELQRALKGMKVGDTTGRLRRWLDYMRHRHGEDVVQFRVTPVAIYCFKGNSLTTVLLMPPEYRKTATAQWRKFRASKLSGGDKKQDVRNTARR